MPRPLPQMRGRGMPGKSNPRRANGHRRTVMRQRVLGSGEPCWICGMPIDLGMPNLHPLQGVVDELVPVSRGGSPIQGDNLAPAHRCCNAWRSAKPVALVRLVQARVAAEGGAADPQAWCAMARRAMRELRAGVEPIAQPKTTTDW